jgi:nucleoside-diphosphate-sugar epimerase
MKKILILGVNGFIGHHLSQRIMDTTDWEVYGMDMNSERVTDLMENPASTSSKATSPSTRSGSSTTSRSAT